MPPIVVNSSVVVPNLYSGRANVSYYLNITGTVGFSYTNLPYISGHDGQNAQFAGSNVTITGSNYDVLTAGSLNATTLTVANVSATYVVTTPTTYASLLSVPGSNTAGARAMINNANTTTFNALVGGGGSNTVPVFYNGTNWRVG